MREDPGQLLNVAEKPEYTTMKKDLAARLKAELRTTKDPRVEGGGEAFDHIPWRRPER